ncbi:n1r/p28-like protein [Albatrosspox virus]|nr:n1r/p28-like protein [Albatrosspox virus]
MCLSIWCREIDERLDGTKELIRKVEEMNSILEVNPTPPDLGVENCQRVIINISNEGTSDKKYEVSGSYVHQDLIPHIASWISPLFAIKASKIINCYVSGKYEFKLKESDKSVKDYKLLRFWQIRV